MECHLRGKTQWKVIQNIIIKQEREAAARLVQNTSIRVSIPESTNLAIPIWLINTWIDTTYKRTP
jgi:hypothetical protein